MADDPATFEERFTGEQQPFKPSPGAEEFALASSKALKGLENYPAHFAQGLLDFFKTPGEAAQHGLTPDQEWEFSINGALATIGSASKFMMPKGTAATVNAFHEQVTTPAAQRLTIPLDERNIAPVQGSNVPQGVTRSQLALTGEPHIDAVINHPVIKGVIDNPIIDRSHEVPNSWGGSVPIDNPVTHIDKDFPRALNVDGVVFDPAEGAAIHENVEEAVIVRLMKGGMDRDAALRAAYWGWGNPAEHAWYRAHGMNPDHVEAAIKPYLDQIAARKANPANIPKDLFKETYPDGDPLKDVPGTIDKPSEQEISRARAIMAQPDDTPVPEPTAPKPAVNPLAEARDLGVIGESRQQPVELDREYQARLEKWVGKIETTADVKQAILQSVAENNQFATSRASMEISLSHVERLADAAGVGASEIDPKLLRTKFQTPEEIKTVEQLMLRLTDKAVEAGNAAIINPTPETQAAHAKALTERDLSIEYVLNLKSEWGKAGNALQQILAKSMRGINDRETQARILSEGAKAIPQPEWYYWLWVQGLLSGPFTHTKYVLANTVYAGMEHALTTPLSAVIGAVKKTAGIDMERVLFGEAMAENWGWITALPDAIRGAGQSIKSGMRAPLTSEKDLFDKMIERGEKPPLSLVRATSELQQPKPIPGVWGRVLGAPGDVASGIHTAFKIMGERAGVDAWAYRQAAAEGLKPTSGDFWNRMADHKANVPVDVLQDTIFKAYKDTFMQPLGPHGQSWAQLVKKVPGLRWLFPFNHIPIDLIKAAYEYTPVAGFDKEMRASILGTEGGIKQDKAIARVIIGSATLAYFANKFMWGNATADYPTDPKERKEWAVSGKQPNSIRIGDSWYSFERFGPAGDLASIATNIASIAQHYDGQDEARFTKSIWMAAHAAANTIANEVGFQSVRNAVDAIEDPRKGERWAAYQAGSFLPYSSFTSQTASFMDPQMRQAKSFIDGLKYRIPLLRETLPPKRNPLSGEPVYNPGFHTIVRSVPVNQDPVTSELDRLGIHVAAPRGMIGHTALTPEQNDKYQATAGPFVKDALQYLIEDPQWKTGDSGWQNTVARAVITAARRDARQGLQVDDPGLIVQGVLRRHRQITGTQ